MTSEKLGKESIKKAMSMLRTKLNALNEAENKTASIDWYNQKLGLTVIEQDLEIPVINREGTEKTYEGVKLSDGKVAIFCRGNSRLVVVEPVEAGKFAFRQRH